MNRTGGMFYFGLICTCFVAVLQYSPLLCGIGDLNGVDGEKWICEIPSSPSVGTDLILVDGFARDHLEGGPRAEGALLEWRCSCGTSHDRQLRPVAIDRLILIDG